MVISDDIITNLCKFIMIVLAPSVFNRFFSNNSLMGESRNEYRGGVYELEILILVFITWIIDKLLLVFMIKPVYKIFTIFNFFF